MTPKEKAKRLVYRFLEYTPAEEEFELPYAKECALITVNEILDAVTTIADKKYDYFIEVKKEIENL